MGLQLPLQPAYLTFESRRAATNLKVNLKRTCPVLNLIFLPNDNCSTQSFVRRRPPLFSRYTSRSFAIPSLCSVRLSESRTLLVAGDAVCLVAHQSRSGLYPGPMSGLTS